MIPMILIMGCSPVKITEESRIRVNRVYVDGSQELINDFRAMKDGKLGDGELW